MIASAARFSTAAVALALAAPGARRARSSASRRRPSRRMDADGHARSLSDFAGKTVVLEWTNSGCPYVGKHYGSGTMQALQKKATAGRRRLADRLLLGARMRGLFHRRRPRGPGAAKSMGRTPPPSC